MLILIAWLTTCATITLISRANSRQSLGNLIPAYLFAIPLVVYMWTLGLSLASKPISSQRDGAAVLQQLVTIAFYGLLVSLFAARSPISGARAGFVQGMVALSGTFILVVAGYLPIAPTASTTMLIASSGLVLLGTLFAFWGVATLGRCFGLFPEARGLVLRGPYRLVRHPAYLGEIIAGVGFLLARPQLLTLALVIAFVALQYLRSIFEERVLAAAFPNEYPAYRATVPRLVPGLRPRARAQVAAPIPVN
jgi:protein-S-isoprenylcysteine O-methyltransferase Ste14